MRYAVLSLCVQLPANLATKFLEAGHALVGVHEDPDEVFIIDKGGNHLFGVLAGSTDMSDRYRCRGIPAPVMSPSMLESWLDRAVASHRRTHEHCIERGWDLQPGDSESLV